MLGPIKLSEDSRQNTKVPTAFCVAYNKMQEKRSDLKNTLLNIKKLGLAEFENKTFFSLISAGSK